MEVENKGQSRPRDEKTESGVEVDGDETLGRSDDVLRVDEDSAARAAEAERVERETQAAIVAEQTALDTFGTLGYRHDNLPSRVREHAVGHFRSAAALGGSRAEAVERFEDMLGSAAFHVRRFPF